MADIAELGFKVDSRWLIKGTKELDRFNKSGNKAETTSKKVGMAVSGAASAIGVSVGVIAAATGVVAGLTVQYGKIQRELEASARLAGVSTDEFKALQFTYSQFGLTVDQVTDIFKDSRERIGEWRAAGTGALQDFGDVMGMTKEQIDAFADEVNDLTGQQLLQRMVNDMQAAGVSANEMSFALEGMASEATRLIPALENNGRAINDLSEDYRILNEAFALDEQEIQNYRDLTREFDLFTATANNAITKTLAPLAGWFAQLSNATTHFVSALQQGSEAQLSSELVDLTETARDLRQSIEDNESAWGRLKNVATFDSTDNEFLIKQLEEVERKILQTRERLAQLRTGTAGLIDTSKPLEIIVKPVVSGIDSTSTSSPIEDLSDIFATDRIDTFSMAQNAAYQQWLDDINNTTSATQDLEMELQAVLDALAANELQMNEGVALYIQNLKDGIDELAGPSGFEQLTNGAMDALFAIQELADDGSKEYMRLEQAIRAVAAAQAIATAATSATTGNIIGAVSSGIAFLSTFQDDLEFDLAAVQREQNVTVFGDKADAISVATDITASATEKLVGINTDMLNAMKVLNNSITGAASQVSRGVMGAEFDNIDLGIIENPLALLTPGLNEALNIVTLGLFKGVGKLLGGKSKVVDQGINIIGGAFDDLLENVTVEAFQKIKFKKSFLHSSKTKTQTTDLGDEVGNQISLVFQSIAESVTAGAESLGLSQSEINTAIRAFNIETEQISLKDLSAEEQKAEIEAYFSQIFSDLAGAVIPFIDEFQIAGEEMGETLARVATQVAVMDTLVEQLGVTMFDKAANPEVYARASDNIAMLVGGVEEFANKTGGFVNNFATDAQKIDIHRQSLESALGAVNLQLPMTSEAMWQLMQSLDGTTEAGQEQIAALLNVQDTASVYFDLLERESDAQKQAAKAAADSAKSYRDMIAAMFDVQDVVARVSLDAALAAARMGDFSVAEGLNLSGLSPQASDFGSFTEFQFAQAVTANKLDELAALTENSVPVEQRQLSVLEEIRDSIRIDTSSIEQETIRMFGKMQSEFENMSRNLGRMQAEANENLEKIANGTITVRQEA